MHWTLSALQCGARLAPQAPLQPLAEAGALPQLFVDSRRRFQAIEGFGGAFTEAAATVWQALGEPAREQFLRDCFDPQAGHGYTLCRVHMNSCDFALGNYAHVETAGDTELASFSIARDRQALLPFIQATLRVAGRPIRLLASPWSPPAWMKTNGRMDQGGRLATRNAAWMKGSSAWRSRTMLKLARSVSPAVSTWA